MQAFQTRCRAALDQQIRHVTRQPCSKLCVGRIPLPLFPLTFLSFQPRALFSLGGLLLASVICGVGRRTRLPHLLCVRTQIVQFSDRARFACVTRFPGLPLFALDALHDVPEFACNLLGFAFPSFAMLFFLVLPQPIGGFPNLRQSLSSTAVTVGAPLLPPFQFALPDELSNILETFACPVRAIEFVGANQLELPRSQ
ncbi:hypothetical protein [Nocardia veterana]|uniref:Uncharacterized protein n=1 Tax=Nocardia veterana TaxID=132249 RepID=A0A7X6LZ29_9NOCA|nr:hypothetical protein [Nocardia veterana]NKY87285.1 hypothetical protein [Nocardia veterana]